MDDNKTLLQLIRQMVPSKLAEELCAVQPMTGIDLTKLGASEEWLTANGYEPISDHGLVWINKSALPPRKSVDCPKCNTVMVIGDAINTDNHAADRIRVMQCDPVYDTGEIVKVWKCPSCGYSEEI